MGIIMAENLRFLGEGSSAQGKSGAKARPEGVVDGEQVNNPVPVIGAMGGHNEGIQPVSGFRWTNVSRRGGG